MDDKEMRRRSRSESVAETIRLSKESIERSRGIIEETKRALAESRGREAKRLPQD